MKWLSHRQWIVSHDWLDQLARLVQLVWLDSFDYQPELFNSFRLIHLINSLEIVHLVWLDSLDKLAWIICLWLTCHNIWKDVSNCNVCRDFFDFFSPLTSSLRSLFRLLWYFHFFVFFWLLNLPNFLKWLYKMLYFAYWRPSKRATVV